VSYKTNPDGSRSPYELNINYFDALNNPRLEEPLAVQVDRFMASQAILLAMIGVPGIYFHSLVGSRGWPEGVAQTGRSRTINRQKLDLTPLEAALADRHSLRARVFARYARLLVARAASPAFHPNGEQQAVECGDAILAFVRRSPDLSSSVLCLQNVSGQAQMASGVAELLETRQHELRDLISERSLEVRLDGAISIDPYGTLWVARESKL